MNTYTLKRLSTLLFCCFFLLASSQPKDVKVGLVLSGGGAKGMAHVGVLKEIERAGVRIDYIGGTSMGAIVGGLYACGYSAVQLEQLLLELDLNDIISDNYDRTAKSFDTKEDDERYAMTLPMVKGKIQFPLSLSKGQNTYNLLVQLMHEQRNIHDFSKLPIPFYCIATDINNGEKVLLEKGFLPLAINASSALPTIFSPVNVNDRLLIDGGVADNYPIDEMLQKEMDVIIGVDTQVDIASSVSPTTFSEVLVRIGSFRTEKTMPPKKAKTSIYIRPEVHDYNMLSFSEQEAIVKKGEDAGKAVFSQLKQLATQQKPVDRPPKKIPDSFQLDRLSISTIPNYKLNYLLGKIRLKPNDSYRFKKLQDGMSNLAATHNFDAFRYTLKTQNGSETLTLDLPEAKHTTFFRGGLHYDDLMGGSALVNLTQKRVLTKNDAVSLDLIFGEYFRYAFSYFIDKGVFWSIGLSATLNQFDTKAPFDVGIFGSPTTFEAQSTHGFVQKNTLYAQTLFQEEMVLGVGISHQKNNFKTNLFNPESGRFLYADNADYYSTYGYLKIDTRDNAFYPNQGGFFEGHAEYFFSQKTTQTLDPFKSFFVGKAEMGVAVPLHKKWTVSFNTMGGFTIGNANTPTFDFRLGGYGNAPVLNFQPFVGLPQQQIRGDSYVKGEVVMDYEWLTRHHMRLLLHSAIVENDIFSTSQWAKKPDFFGLGLAYGLETFAGPLEITTAYSPQLGKLVYHASFGWRF